MTGAPRPRGPAADTGVYRKGGGGVARASASTREHGIGAGCPPAGPGLHAIAQPVAPFVASGLPWALLMAHRFSPAAAAACAAAAVGAWFTRGSLDVFAGPRGTTRVAMLPAPVEFVGLAA